MAEQVIVISFDHRSVQRVKALDSRVVTGVLYAARPTDAGVGLAAAAQADAVLPHWAYVTPEDVRAAHEAGVAVAPWATSDPEGLRSLITAGGGVPWAEYSLMFRGPVGGRRGRAPRPGALFGG